MTGCLLITRSAVRARPGEPTKQRHTRSRQGDSEYDPNTRHRRSEYPALALLLALAMPAAALELPDDPRALDAWAMYSRDGNCGAAARCIDGYRTRQFKRVWIPVYVTDLGLPPDTRAVHLLGMMNLTHPAADRSVCKVFAMLADDQGIEDVAQRRDRQWAFRLLSSPETGSLRDTQGAWVRVEGGRFWLRYWYSGDGDYDAGRCSYGLRLSVDAWD